LTEYSTAYDNTETSCGILVLNHSLQIDLDGTSL